MSLYAKFKPGDRFAILSSVFYCVKVHFIKSERKFIQCLAPDRCFLCEKNFKKWDRFGAFVYDYQETNPQFRIKGFVHQSEILNKYFYSIAINSGLQSLDYIYGLKKSKSGTEYIHIETVKDSLPLWYQKKPDEVKKLWEDFEEEDIKDLIGRHLIYSAQVAFIDQINKVERGEEPVPVKNAVSQFLASPTKPGNSPSQGKGNKPKEGEFSSNRAFSGIPDDLM